MDLNSNAREAIQGLCILSAVATRVVKKCCMILQHCCIKFIDDIS
jgi:hypothetical protein